MIPTRDDYKIELVVEYFVQAEGDYHRSYCQGYSVWKAKVLVPQQYSAENREASFTREYGCVLLTQGHTYQ